MKCKVNLKENKEKLLDRNMKRGSRETERQTCTLKHNRKERQTYPDVHRNSY